MGLPSRGSVSLLRVSLGGGSCVRGASGASVSILALSSVGRSFFWFFSDRVIASVGGSFFTGVSRGSGSLLKVSLVEGSCVRGVSAADVSSPAVSLVGVKGGFCASVASPGMSLVGGSFIRDAFGEVMSPDTGSFFRGVSGGISSSRRVSSGGGSFGRGVSEGILSLAVDLFFSSVSFESISSVAVSFVRGFFFRGFC